MTVQKHHIVYTSDKNKEVKRTIRKGVHTALTWIRRFNYLTDEEISCIITECLLKQRFEGN